MTANYDDSSAIPPLSVRIIGDETKQEKRPHEVRTAHRTIVLNAANPYVQVAGYDPARIEIYMNVLDNIVVISGDMGQASDLANTSGTNSAPNGRIMPIGIDYCLKGQDEMWVSGATYPARVGITIIREI